MDILTKIVDNFNYLNCAEPLLVKQQQVINLLSSPTHSPVSNKSSNNSTNKKSTVRQLKKNSNEQGLIDAKKPSLLLLMVQQNGQNLKSVNNENLTERSKKSAKSMSNLLVTSQTSGNSIQSVNGVNMNNNIKICLQNFSIT